MSKYYFGAHQFGQKTVSGLAEVADLGLIIHNSIV